MGSTVVADRSSVVSTFGATHFTLAVVTVFTEGCSTIP